MSSFVVFGMSQKTMKIQLSWPLMKFSKSWILSQNPQILLAMSCSSLAYTFHDSTVYTNRSILQQYKM